MDAHFNSFDGLFNSSPIVIWHQRLTVRKPTEVIQLMALRLNPPHLSLRKDHSLSFTGQIC